MSEPLMGNISSVICALKLGFRGEFCPKIPTSGETGQKWGTLATRAMIAAPILYIYTPTGCGFVASNWRNTYCKIPPLA